jgi:hypothetical protein
LEYDLIVLDSNIWLERWQYKAALFERPKCVRERRYCKCSRRRLGNGECLDTRGGNEVVPREGYSAHGSPIGTGGDEVQIGDKPDSEVCGNGGLGIGNG